MLVFATLHSFCVDFHCCQGIPCSSVCSLFSPVVKWLFEVLRAYSLGHLFTFSSWRHWFFWWIWPWQAYDDKFPGLELEDGGGRGTAGMMNLISLLTSFRLIKVSIVCKPLQLWILPQMKIKLLCMISYLTLWGHVVQNRKFDDHTDLGLCGFQWILQVQFFVKGPF